jgi:hypothetical protein
MVPVGEGEVMAMAFRDEDSVGYSPLQIPLYLISAQMCIMLVLLVLWRWIHFFAFCMNENQPSGFRERLAAVFWLPGKWT